MKVNRYWLCLLLIITAVTIVMFLVRKSNKHPHSQIETILPTQKESPAKTNNQPHPSQKQPVFSTISQQTIQSTNQVSASRLELLKLDLEQKNVPVNFYGKVIDQNSNSVPDAHIVCRVRQWHLDAKWGNIFPEFERTTDSDGIFTLENAAGDSLTIESVSKEGYRLSQKTQMGYGYGDVSNPHHPDQQNPIIIKMWKLGELQQLISHHLTRIGLPVDGQPIQFDLFNGKKIPSDGQLIVRLKRDPEILPPGNARYGWSLELEIPNGGLVAINDDFMYQAPESGYQEIFKFNIPKDADNWTTALDQQFYIQLKNGKSFGSLDVHLSTIHDTPPLGINLDIVINPGGSRSLQP